MTVAEDRVTKAARINIAPPRDDEWKAHGRCVTEKVDPRFFDGTKAHRFAPTVYSEEAKAFCQSCPVRGFCLEDAIVNQETECVRGGLTPDEYMALGSTPTYGRLKQPGEQGYKRKLRAVVSDAGLR